MAFFDVAPVQIPRQATLDGFIGTVLATEGVSIRDVEPLTTLVVRTCNSVYRIVVSQNGSILVQGGRFFPDATPGHLNGSSTGGSLLRLSWIGIGLRMEFWVAGVTIITSPVRAIVAERAVGDMRLPA